MTDEQAAEWARYQEERHKRSEERERQQRDYHVRTALATLATYGHPAPGDVEKLKSAHEALKMAHQAAQDELAAARLAVDGDHQAAELARMKQGLRDRDHFDAWKELAAEAGMNPKAIKHAWQEVQANGFKAEQEEVDRKTLGALMDGMRSSHDYFWPSAPAETPASPAEARESKSAPAAATNGVAHIFDRGGWRN